jgi:mono/diheme cytochrome c family protein
LVATGCAGSGEPPSTTTSLDATQTYGRDVWLNASFGGQFFFSLIAPNAPINLPLGFDSALTTPRADRFAQWGLLNDPDCTDGDATTGYLDKCPPGRVPPSDPSYQVYGESSGVVGVRKFQNPFFGQPAAATAAGLPASAASLPLLFGVSCAGCHAGWDPANPPADTAAPTWANIHLTAGNQYIQIGKIFGAHLTPADPRWQVFHSWKAGTVDTTAIESDHINNPGIITQFWDVPARPFFDLTYSNFSVIDPPQAGSAIHVHRGGQGGEDDTGCEMAALRVYFNIGMCAAECMLPHLTNGAGGTQTPIDLAACEQACPFYAAAKQAVVPMCDFMATTTPPALPAQYVNQPAAARGKVVFQKYCASCHSNGQPVGSDANILSDDLLHAAKGPLANELAQQVGTNSCRSKTTNWQAGQIWAAFSSDEQKARGPGFYRDVPLRGAWATAPFFHNNQLGAQPDLSSDAAATATVSIQGRLALFGDAMDKLLNPWKRSPIVEVTTQALVPPAVPLPLPAGTPIALFANLDPANPLHNLCPDLVENEGHYFGSLLSGGDKSDLTEFLKTQ